MPVRQAIIGNTSTAGHSQLCRWPRKGHPKVGPDGHLGSGSLLPQTYPAHNCQAASTYCSTQTVLLVMQEFDGPALSNCLWAFAQLRHYPGASLLTAAAVNICCSLDGFTPQVCLTGLFMCLLCASFNLAGCNPGGRLTALGRRCAAQQLQLYHQLLQA